MECRGVAHGGPTNPSRRNLHMGHAPKSPVYLKRHIACTQPLNFKVKAQGYGLQTWREVNIYTVCRVTATRLSGVDQTQNMAA